MQERLREFTGSLTTGFWFIPGLMAAVSIVLSVVTIAIDRSIDWDVSGDSPLIYGGTPEGARALTATIAGSMITVAGVVFSITIAALVLASSQFGPRLLRNFIRDIGNQLVLGTFIAAFAYCLVVMRSIKGGDEDAFVPQVSVSVALLFAMGGLVVLIYFIHHVASSIQVTNVILSVSRDLQRSIRRLVPEGWAIESDGDLAEDDEAAWTSDSRAVVASASGYVQAMNLKALLDLASERDLSIRVEYHPGRFVLEGTPLVLARPADRVSYRVERQMQRAIKIGPVRTPHQDVEFAIDQLVEIAVRALSPGINDPFTAISCVDQLGASLVEVVERPPPARVVRSEDGQVRIIAPHAGFSSIVDAAFNQIRQYGGGSAAVTMRLLETITAVIRRTQTEEQRLELLRHARMIERGSHGGLRDESDREDVQERYAEVRRVYESFRADASA